VDGDGLMHASVMEWLRQVHDELGDASSWKILEVGSYDENGSPREVFAEVGSYWGIDMREGRGVDEVMHAYKLGWTEEVFDLVICTEMLEHDRTPWISVQEMGRVLKRGGHLLLTARGFDAYTGYPEHPCPEDYWRFNRSSFAVLLDYAGLVPSEILMDSGKEAPGVFAHAVKP
jgi:SAM-dependent methyltransferase